VIKTFKCKATASLFAGNAVLRWVNIRRVAERKLQMLNRATQLDDLRIPPNNRLEPLQGSRAGQLSIRTTTNGACASDSMRAAPLT
jgi:proteic killer suppression protein